MGLGALQTPPGGGRSARQFPAGGCVGAAAAVNHTTGERSYSFAWGDFQDGSPDDTPDPSEITAIRWEFQATAPLPVDFYVDDIRFIE